MPIVKLLHNPRAGDKDHSKEKLISLIEQEGFECNYCSVKEEGWHNVEPGTDIIVIVGGDGTVRKAAKALLKTDGECPYLVGLLPFGTANNIAKTLKIKGSVEDIIKSWHNKNIVPFDVTYVNGLKNPVLFLEGFGFGVFPQLMREMKNVDKKQLDTPEKEIKKALEVLKNIVLNYEAKSCTIEVDHHTLSGRYLLAEAMNICSIGPNLHLAPHASVNDGVLEVALLPEEQRQQFADHLQQVIDGNSQKTFAFTTVSGSKITFNWDGTDLHADDEVIEIEAPAALKLTVRPGLMNFLVP